MLCSWFGKAVLGSGTLSPGTPSPGVSIAKPVSEAASVISLAG
jgi:hypothetical protein